MVFTSDVDAGGRPLLITLAFGVRHPRRAWQPSVYQVAHARMHDVSRAEHSSRHDS
jgi:hypothetical protein